MRRREFLIGGLAAASLLGLGLSACQSAGSAAKPAALAKLSPDMAKALESLPARTQEAYYFAMEQPDVLRYIPCYCGCNAEGHVSNLDCFVQSETETAIALDAHGAT